MPLVLVGTCGLGIAASLIWIQFLLKTPLGVLSTQELGVSAFWRTSPGIDHLFVEGSCSLTDCFGRSLGSSLVCASYLLCFFLVCGETLTVFCWSTAWLLAGWSSAVYSAVTQKSSILLKWKLISYY